MSDDLTEARLRWRKLFKERVNAMVKLLERSRENTTPTPVPIDDK